MVEHLQVIEHNRYEHNRTAHLTTAAMPRHAEHFLGQIYNIGTLNVSWKTLVGPSLHDTDSDDSDSSRVALLYN